MKRKEIKSLHTKNREELVKDLVTKKKELVQLQVERVTKPVKNTRMLSQLRDQIARMSTILQEKQKEKTKV